MLFQNLETIKCCSEINYFKKGGLGRIYTHVMRGFQNITPGIGNTYVNGILMAKLTGVQILTISRKKIEHKILSKMLLPDDIRDLAGRAINFSKKAGI